MSGEGEEQGSPEPPPAAVQEDAGSVHPLAALAKNPATVVAAHTFAEVFALFRTVAACLEAFAQSPQAADGAARGKAEQHACFLLQCASFLSLHVLRSSSRAAANEADAGGQDAVEIVKDMTVRVLETLEWAGSAGASGVGAEAIKTLAVICVEKNITQETLISARDKITSHRAVPLQELLVSAPHAAGQARPAQSDPVANGTGLSPQLSLLTRPLVAAGLPLALLPAAGCAASRCPCTHD
jgi:hypothetical protein